MAVLFVLLIGILFGSYAVGNKRTSEGLVHIAVSCDDSDGIMKYLIGFVGGMSSLRNFCSLESTDYISAMEMLKSGEADIVIDIPTDFYAKAESMQDVSLRMYVPHDSMLAGSKLIALFDSVETMMITTEAAIYTMYEVMDVYDVSMSISAMENALFNDIISQFMNRDAIFDVKSVSLFGQYDFVQFYFVTIIQVITLLFGISFMKTYRAENLQLEKMIAGNLCKRAGMSVVHVISMALPVAFTWSIVLFLYNRICVILREYDRCVIGTSFIVILGYSLLVAVYFHLCCALLCIHEQGITIYALVSLIILVLSGELIPAVFLPDVLRKISVYNPVTLWQQMLLLGLWGKNGIGVNLTGLLITSVSMTATAILLYCRRLVNHG